MLRQFLELQSLHQSVTLGHILGRKRRIYLGVWGEKVFQVIFPLPAETEERCGDVLGPESSLHTHLQYMLGQRHLLNDI